ncbi:MAG: cytochrome c, partial [Betaproteobacteria bacterium]|nr:cytochrome c [Betaproteobacteria bacterium]
LWLLALLVACEEHEFQPPSRAERVAAAEKQYSPAAFDTVRWPGRAARLMAGNVVYAANCRKCHGPLGRGDTEYARQHGLRVPSLVERSWPYATSIDSVRHRITVGHPAGMPTWGVAGISPREIDAVAFYIVQQLRPEVRRQR